MTLMLEVPPGLETALQANAQARGLTVEQYVLALVERDASVPAPPPGSENWTLQDALDYAGPLPENLAAACAVASQEALGRIWNNPEDDAAWPAS
ncbi:MAG: hypothetical protein JO250_20260 [Armatimonadetes bacterium]|nr:hypothetical protein [Armatimonadota bacterium]